MATKETANAIAERLGKARDAAVPYLRRLGTAAQKLKLPKLASNAERALKQLPAPDEIEETTSPLVKLEDFDTDTVRDMVLAGEKVPQSWIPYIDALDFAHTGLTDANQLSRFTNLTHAYLNYTNITDLAPLEKLTNLTTLNLCNTQITEFAPLENLASLTELNLYKTQFTNLAPLENLANLTALILGHTPISDLLPLKKLTNLTTLYLNNTKITDDDPVLKLLKDRGVKIFR